jgi:beta-xylosidase
VTLTKTYHNPVYRGDSPDPSVIRVGDRDFYATTTSTEWAPQFPLLHSRDLVHWQQVGAVFPKPPEWAVGKFWAPEISYHNGTFFVYYVAEHRDGPLTIGVATAKHAQGPYTDHPPLVGQTSGSIDPTPVTGEDGRRYLIWKEDGNSRGLPTTIWVQPLSADGLSLTGAAKPILENDAPWEGNVVEAPSVIKHGEYYYLFYSGNSCCGLNCKYAVGVARARSIMGPWEKYPRNPIIKSNANWRCPGHGSAVTTSDGRTYYLYHAYAKHESIFVGRQTLLDEIRWDASGWPSVNGGKGPSCEAPLPYTRPHAVVRAMFAPHASQWQWPQAHPPRVLFRKRFGREDIVLGPPSPSAGVDALACVLARSPHFGNYVAETAIDVTKLTPGTEAGLCAFGDRRNAVGITYQDGIVSVWQRVKGKHTVLEQAALVARGPVRLRMSARRGYNFRFEVHTPSGWSAVRAAPLRAAYLPPWDRGIRVALTVGGSSDAQAEFRFLRIRKAAENVQLRVVPRKEPSVKPPKPLVALARKRRAVAQ